MQKFRNIVFLMVPVFILVSCFATSAFAKKKNKHWKKENISAYKNTRNDYYEDWRDEIRYGQGHRHYNDCELPPGLAKKGKSPPGWSKKCRHQKVKHHTKKHREYYPDRDHDHDHERPSGSHDKPTIEGGIDIGFGIHIPFP